MVLCFADDHPASGIMVGGADSVTSPSTRGRYPHGVTREGRFDHSRAHVGARHIEGRALVIFAKG